MFTVRSLLCRDTSNAVLAELYGKAEGSAETERRNEP